LLGGSFNEIGHEPDFETVEQALVTMRKAKPDTIIALGGGSVMDAAKIIRLFYDYPDLKMSEIAVNFLDSAIEWLNSLSRCTLSWLLFQRRLALVRK